MPDDVSWLGARADVLADSMVWNALWETIMMVGVSGGIAIIVGIPLGVIMMMTSKKGWMPSALVNSVLGEVINVLRSIPFIILCVYFMPATRWLVGTTIGTVGAIPPLALAATPFMARIAEVAFKEVPGGLIEAAQAMGAKPLQIIKKVLIAESMPALISGVTIMLVTLTGYSAIVGMVGGGGLGALAINYGYSRYRGDVMDAVMLVIIIFVIIAQHLGDWMAAKTNHR